jgi:serine/threonine protein kinase
MSSRTNPNNARISDTNERLAVGDKVGRYRLIALLASGGMGHVWAARPEGDGFARTVALKVVRSEMSQDENYARMFIDEATVASAIRHPNVCETFELGRHNGSMFMAMEWVSGDSLAGLLRNGEVLVALEPSIAARIIADACAGLHAAHESVGPDGTLLGVVHRDVSPPNILVSLQGQAKVSDFGIAKARHQLHERTRTGEVKGKFAYIPPEQLAGGTVDRRADIYAMGCVLYVATLGSRPFGNGAEAMSKILRNEYKVPHRVRADYPPELEAIIVRALAGRAENRYQTAEEMQIALEEWLLSGGKVVSASDVAQCVQSRLNPEIRARNAALMTQNRVLPDQLLTPSQHADKDSETPTAGSGLVTAPPGIWVGRGVAECVTLTDRALRIDPAAFDSVQRIAIRKPALSLNPRASDATQLVEVTVVQPDVALPLPSVTRAPWNIRRLAVAAIVVATLLLLALFALRVVHRS